MSGSRQHSQQQQQHQQEPGKHEQPVADKKESTVGVERHAAEPHESAGATERHPARTPERADTGERLAEQSERADMEERDADADQDGPPAPQILCMSLQSVSDEENPDGVDQELCCAIINLPLTCDGANIAARQHVQLVLARDADELQLRGVAALISEYRMTQDDATAAWSSDVVWMQAPPPAADAPPTGRRAMRRA